MIVLFKAFACTTKITKKIAEENSTTVQELALNICVGKINKCNYRKPKRGGNRPRDFLFGGTADFLTGFPLPVVRVFFFLPDCFLGVAFKNLKDNLTTDFLPIGRIIGCCFLRG